ncbi:hypothetical protein O6H91_02G100500 [Diphasiastrum complanatum]|uniref:Uncharacterized protein n=1 Tax=Diphasiastrum complanatum TaxID=34168 RepID=A0ACC2EJ35_DIPCM|nr:hypothetical protein O6H91_02G100500 [Diphasiastrum complanatum]
MIGTLALALSSMGSNLVSGIFVPTVLQIFSTWISDTFYVEYFRLSQKNNKNMAFVLDSLQQLVTSMNPLVLARAIHSGLLFLLQTDSTYYYLITKICVFRLLFPTLVKLSQNIAPATLLCTVKMFELLHL